MTESIASRRIRRFRPSPDWFATASLAAVCLLWLSERFRWFGLDHQKGAAVLIAAAIVAAATIIVLLWWVASMHFRWRFQFGIRSLLVLGVVCSTVASWLAAERGQSQRQAKTVEAIRSLGGRIWYGDLASEPNQPVPFRSPSLGRIVLGRIFGDDFFSTVVSIDASGTQISDKHLENLGELTCLQALALENTNATDTVLDQVKCLSEIKALDLAGTKVTDAGLSRLDGLSRLTSLSLANTQVIGPGLEHLVRLEQLKSLDLSGTNLTDMGLAHLVGVVQLQTLDLQCTLVSNAGLQRLTALSGLKSLDVSNTEATDDGVNKLREMWPLCTVAHVDGPDSEPDVDDSVWPPQVIRCCTCRRRRGLNWLRIFLELLDTPANRQREAVEAVRSQGGYVEYDFQRGKPVSKWLPPPKPPGPDWLRNLIGVDYFASVYSAGSSDAEHFSLAPLPDFPHLTDLQLSCAVTDGGWEPLDHLQQLEDLALNGPNVTDETLKHVKGLTNIKVLYLGQNNGNPQVTDAGLKYVAGLTSLEQLYLQGCSRVTDGGLMQLAVLPRLQEINMSGTRCTPAGLRQLRQALPRASIVGP